MTKGLWVGWEGLRRAGGPAPRERRRVLEPPGSRFSPNPGAEGEDRRRALLPPPPWRGGAGAGPAGPRRRCQPGRTVLSAPRPRGAAGPGSRASLGRPGSAAMSATHPTRLETRTKESSTCASQGPLSKARGAMKVRAGARRLRWDPGARRRAWQPRAHHRPVSPAAPSRGRGGGA